MVITSEVDSASEDSLPARRKKRRGGPQKLIKGRTVIRQTMSQAAPVMSITSASNQELRIRALSPVTLRAATMFGTIISVNNKVWAVWSKFSTSSQFVVKAVHRCSLTSTAHFFIGPLGTGFEKCGLQLSSISEKMHSSFQYAMNLTGCLQVSQKNLYKKFIMQNVAAFLRKTRKIGGCLQTLSCTKFSWRQRNKKNLVSVKLTDRHFAPGKLQRKLFFFIAFVCERRCTLQWGVHVLPTEECTYSSLVSMRTPQWRVTAILKVR